MKEYKNPYRENPKYKEIADIICKDIRSGVYKIGQKLPGASKLGQIYKTSAVTANRALSELEAIGLVRRDARSGTYVSSATEPLKRILAITSEDWNINDPQLIYYLNGVMKEASKHNIDVQVLDPESEVFSSTESLKNSGAQGIILWGQNEENFPREIIADSDIPRITIGKDKTGCSTILNDDRSSAVYEMIQCMLKEGAKKIGFIGNKNKHNHRTSCDGYLSAVKNAGIYDKSLIYNTAVKNIAEIIAEILSGNNIPDTLIVPGVDILKVITLLWKAKTYIRIGGFKESIALERLKGIIWMIDLDHQQLGSRAVQILKQIVSGENKAETILLKAKIISPEK